MSVLNRLYREAEEAGIDVFYFPMESCTSISAPDNCIAIDTDRLTDNAQEAACLAHEMGHCRTGSFYCVDSPLAFRGRQETRAQRWAIRRLVPLEELKLALQAGITAPFELAQYFEVPQELMEQAVAYYRDAKGLL